MGKARGSLAEYATLRTRSVVLSSCSLTVCIALLGAKNLDRYDYTRRIAWCMDVQSRASALGIDPKLVAGLSFHESSFREVTSRKGAKGVMQVMPDIHCSDINNCDLVDVGLEYLQYWLNRTKSPVRAICHYNSGNICKPAGARWAVQVMKTVDILHKKCEEETMPKVGKKKFAYTEKGKKAAKAYATKKKKTVRKKK